MAADVARLPAAEDAVSAPEVEGRVLPFPAPERTVRPPSAQQEQPRTCLLCQHVAIGAVTYCSRFHEEILFESIAAQDCEEYAFDDDAALTWGD